MSNLIKDFNQYYEEIKNSNGPKVGELKDKECQITNISEHKSQKSGKTSIQLTINVDGSEISTYMGLTSDKSREISLARLTKLSVAAIGIEATKKLYEDAMTSEDNDSDEERLMDFALKVGKKLRKAPANVIVTRTKDQETGIWDCNWRLADNNAFISALKSDAQAHKTQEPTIPGETKEADTGDFLDSLK
jgi:hypothetical protein